MNFPLNEITINLKAANDLATRQSSGAIRLRRAEMSSLGERRWKRVLSAVSAIQREKKGKKSTYLTDERPSEPFKRPVSGLGRPVQIFVSGENQGEKAPKVEGTRQMSAERKRGERQEKDRVSSRNNQHGTA